MKSIIDLLRDLRVDHDLTQADVASLLGISQQHYSLYENGIYDLPLRHFVVLVDHYNISADYFLGRCSLQDKTGTDTIYVTKAYTASQLLSDTLSLDKTGREMLVQYIAFLKYRQENMT